MAKRGFGEASGARDRYFRHAGGLYRRGRRSQRASSAPGARRVTDLRHDRSSASGVLGLITRNPIGKKGRKGRQICLGMGLYQRQTVDVHLEIFSACHAQKVRLVQWSFGEEEPRLRRVEATYRITLRQDSPDCSLLHGAESLRYGSHVFVKPPDGSCGLGHNFRPGASRTRDFHTSGFQRRGEDCNPESLAGALSGMLPQPFSILVLPPQSSIAPTSLFGHGRR